MKSSDFIESPLDHFALGSMWKVYDNLSSDISQEEATPGSISNVFGLYVVSPSNKESKT